MSLLSFPGRHAYSLTSHNLPRHHEDIPETSRLLDQNPDPPAAPTVDRSSYTLQPSVGQQSSQAVGATSANNVLFSIPSRVISTTSHSAADQHILRRYAQNNPLISSIHRRRRRGRRRRSSSIHRRVHRCASFRGRAGWNDRTNER